MLVDQAAGAGREIAVVLVRPREEGNVGAAARAMANMGLARLILVEPAAELGNVARAFAVGAREVLDRCSRAGSLREALAPFARVVATTSTRDRSLAVPLIAPRELPAMLAADPEAAPVALVFGPEVGGLTNDELAFANLVVTVRCAPRQPTLNLAQAVLIVAYELYQAGLVEEGGDAAGAGTAGARARAAVAGAAGAGAAGAGPAGAGVAGAGAAGAGPTRAGAAGAGPSAPATSAEVDALFDHGAAVLRRIGFERDDTFPGVLRDLRAAAARACLSRRETAILHGICRRADHALRAHGAPAGPRGPGAIS